MRDGGYPIDGEFYYFDDNAVFQYGKRIEVVDPYNPSWNSWMYAKEDGTLVTGWHKINNKWYYFYSYTLVMDSYFDIESGDFETSEHHAFDKNGALIEKEGCQHMHHWFFEDSYNWVYVQKDGSLVKDQWKKISNKWYYFDGVIMQTGWINLSGNWYFLNNSGAMETGWNSILGKWYYMNNSGAMQTGWNSISGKWYYMNNSGRMLTGWQKIGGN